MSNYVFSVTSLVTEKWYVEADSETNARRILFQEGEIIEGDKDESLQNVSLLEVDDE